MSVFPPSPQPPVPPVIPPSAEHSALHAAVVGAVASIPAYFDSRTSIEGLEAGDLFSLNTVLGATIEVQVVKTLNQMRSVWDPDDEYADYYFERQAQTFPDVRLVRRGAATGAEVAMGIELKGWYLLAKENMPSLRYRVSPAVCADLDLIVVVPWHLSNVLSGFPVAVSPWVESAKYAAEYRNYHWTHLRSTKADPSIASPAGVGPYPAASDHISDVPAYDGGNNFGRIARVEPLMGEFITSVLATPVAGIPARDWVAFFRSYVETRDPDAISAALLARYANTAASLPDEDAQRLQEVLDDLVRLLGDS